MAAVQYSSTILGYGFFITIVVSAIAGRLVNERSTFAAGIAMSGLVIFCGMVLTLHYAQ